MTKDSPNWKIYERFVARVISEEIQNIEKTAMVNTYITGYLSGTKRQIDLLIDSRFDDNTRKRIIVDAKNHNRKLDVKAIESFEGMMKDVRASRGYIVCPLGYTEAAKRRADRNINLRILNFDDLDSLEINSWHDCRGKCANNNSHGKYIYDW